MPDLTYSEGIDAAYSRMTRGEADDAIYQMYISKQTSADDYIAYLRDELHEAWGKLYKREHPDETQGGK